MDEVANEASIARVLASATAAHAKIDTMSHGEDEVELCAAACDVGYAADDSEFIVRGDDGGISIAEAARGDGNGECAGDDNGSAANLLLPLARSDHRLCGRRTPRSSVIMRKP